MSIVEQLDLPLQNLFFRSNQDDSPLLIVMHGLGDTMYSYQDFPELLFKKEIHTILFNAPFPYFMGGKWYDLEGNQEDGLRNSRKYIEESIEILKNLFPIKKEKIFLSGFSQGGVVSLYTGLRSLEPYGGIVCLSGYLYGKIHEFTKESFKTPIYMAHGIYDELIPLELTKQHAQYLSQNGYQVQWEEYPMGHSIIYEELSSLKKWLQNQMF